MSATHLLTILIVLLLSSFVPRHLTAHDYALGADISFLKKTTPQLASRK